MLKQCDRTLIDLNKSLEIDHDQADALTIRGNVYLDLEEYDSSLNNLNKSLTIKPNNALTCIANTG